MYNLFIIHYIEKQQEHVEKLKMNQVEKEDEQQNVIDKAIFQYLLNNQSNLVNLQNLEVNMDDIYDRKKDLNRDEEVVLDETQILPHFE